MKKLNLLDQSTSFKVNDTGTVIPFNAFENNQPFGVTENETLIFRIKNDMGFLKAVNATSAAGGYIFQLNTKDLVGLVPGTYEIELVVTDAETNGELIFPDNGFCSFNITTSALTVTGTQIPTMSLDSFKQQLEQYVQIQADTKAQQIKNDFSTYVESVKQGPQGEPGPAGAPGNDGEAATVVVGKTITADSGQSASVTNSGTSSAAILDFTLPAGPQGPQGEPGPAGTSGNDGKAATITVGKTTTAGVGQSASVTNSGTSNAAVLDFAIPAGPQGEKGDTGDIGSYCVSTGWLQNGFTFPSNASAMRLRYKIDTINGSSLLTLFCSVRFPLSDMNGWGKVIATFPSNVTVDTTTNIFMYCVTAGGYCNLKVKNNQIILNTWQNLGNVGSDGLVEFNFNGIYPVTLK